MTNRVILEYQFRYNIQQTLFINHSFNVRNVGVQEYFEQVTVVWGLSYLAYFLRTVYFWLSLFTVFTGRNEFTYREHGLGDEESF